jgi:Recombination endonuclease VII
MPAKGRITTDESRERYRQAALRRPSQLVRFGFVTQQEFDRATADGLKWCGKCKAFKAPEDFSLGQKRCRGCHEREKARGKQYSLSCYGVDQEWYDKTLAEQGGGCAICHSTVAGGQGRFHVDHNHSCHTESKTACDKCRRGLLCSSCNVSLARLESDHDWFPKALEYLKKHGNHT